MADHPGDRERLRVPGKGGDGIAGGSPGDLYLEIRLAPHSRFKAVGHDLDLERIDVLEGRLRELESQLPR